MISRRHSLIAALGACIFFLFSSGTSFGQQKFPITTNVEASETTYTQQLAIEAGDRPNHQVRIYEIRRRHDSTPMFLRDVKVQESWSRGTSDYADSNGQNIY